MFAWLLHRLKDYGICSGCNFSSQSQHSILSAVCKYSTSSNLCLFSFKSVGEDRAGDVERDGNLFCYLGDTTDGTTAGLPVSPGQSSLHTHATYIVCVFVCVAFS